MLSRNVIGQLSRGVATTPKEIFVKRPEAEAFIKRCMTAVKTNPKHAEQLAQCLVAADYRGHYSHGFNRLGLCDPKNISKSEPLLGVLISQLYRHSAFYCRNVR